MPDIIRSTSPQIPDVSRNETASNDRAKQPDFQLFRDIIESQDCPDVNGHSTMLCREQGHAAQPQSNVRHLPLIVDGSAAVMSVMAAMLRAKTVTEKTGQSFVVFTADHQLYKVDVH